MRPAKEFNTKQAEELYAKGFTDIEIADEMKVSYHKVFTWRREAELPRNKTVPLLEVASQFQMKLDDGKTENEVVVEMGISEHKLKRVKKALKSRSVGKAIRLIQSGKSDTEISKTLKMSRQRIHQIRKAAGVPPQRNTQKKECLRRIKELYLRGMNDHLIAEEIGIRSETVGLYRRNDLHLPALTHTGHKEDILKKMKRIEALSKKNLTDKQMAKKLDMSQPQVMKLRREMGIPSSREKRLASLKGVQ